MFHGGAHQGHGCRFGDLWYDCVCACVRVSKSQRQHRGRRQAREEPPPRSLSTVAAVSMRQPAVRQKLVDN